MLSNSFDDFSKKTNASEKTQFWQPDFACESRKKSVWLIAKFFVFVNCWVRAPKREDRNDQNKSAKMMQYLVNIGKPNFWLFYIDNFTFRHLELHVELRWWGGSASLLI